MIFMIFMISNVVELLLIIERTVLNGSLSYRHVGERVRVDLQRKQSLPSNKLANLMTKFDEVRTSGNMMPTATLAIGTIEGKIVVI